ncbi:hypothetical protein OIU79_014891 [Salix purpurea]|uniref:Uncharacterized protein n=1 Tax=Salix purpurea TaxID=77065 RepID=A0A9Q0SPL3_SALPP|nr:hypothetical protein OIU79_014891 [Salix purpurea]
MFFKSSSTFTAKQIPMNRKQKLVVLRTDESEREEERIELFSGAEFEFDRRITSRLSDGILGAQAGTRSRVDESETFQKNLDLQGYLVSKNQLWQQWVDPSQRSCHDVVWAIMVEKSASLHGSFMFWFSITRLDVENHVHWVMYGLHTDAGPICAAH